MESPNGRDNKNVVVEPDRHVAIRRALELARPGDVVVIAGKGHETYQEIAGERLPFDDAVEARAVLSSALRDGPLDLGCDRGDGGSRQLAARGLRPVLGLLVSGGVALWVSILLTPVLIRYFRSREIGQHIREDGPASHSVKAGTPTMGGIAIVAGTVLGYAVGHIDTQVRFSRTGYLTVGAVVAFGLIGYLDDYIKVHRRRSLGLNKRAKSGAQLVCAIVFAELAVHWAHTSTALSFTRAQPIGINLGSVGWVIFAVLVMVGTSNAVNITDGVDGLAAGSGTFCFAVLSIMGYWIFRHEYIYHVLPASAIDLALARGRPRGRLHRLPVVERSAGQDHHGRHGIPGHRRRAGRALPPVESRSPAADHRRPLRHGDAVGDHAGHQLPGVPPPHLPHGAHPPPLRAGRLARDDGDRPLLDPRRALLRARARHLLRRLPDGGEIHMTLRHFAVAVRET